MKYLVIGDIHGCYDELQDLLQAAGLGEDDRVISIGDLVDRGPNSPRVLEFFSQTPNAQSLMGNHERKHVRSYRGETRPALSQLITRRQIGEEAYGDACEFMESLPRYLELPEAVLVHGFFEPGVSLTGQLESVIVGTMSGGHYLHQRFAQPWYQHYDGDKPLIVGHYDYLRTGQPLVHDDKVYAIDTGCCHGGRLTGILLPEFRLISVSSRRDYWSELQDQHADIRYGTTKDEQLSWTAAQALANMRLEERAFPPHTVERIERVRQLLQNGERAVHSLFDVVMRNHHEALDQLERETNFDQLSEKDQGRTYAAAIGKSHLTKFLHQVRRGQLDIATLRESFKGPAEALRYVERHQIGPAP